MSIAKHFATAAAVLVALASPLSATRAEAPATPEGTVGRLGLSIRPENAGLGGPPNRYLNQRVIDLAAQFLDAADRCDLARLRSLWNEAGKLPRNLPGLSRGGVNPFSAYGPDAIISHYRQNPGAVEQAREDFRDGNLVDWVKLLLIFVYQECDKMKAGLESGSGQIKPDTTGSETGRQPPTIRGRQIYGVGPEIAATIRSDRPQFLIDGIVGNDTRPGFGAGTMFNVALGHEVAILLSPRNLTFAGGTAEFRAPASSLFGANTPSLFSEVAFYAKLEGRSFWGSNGATVPIGAANVAYTYLFPNPATGTTGVLAGASGQDIGIKVNGEAIRARAGVEIRMPSLPELRAMYSVITGGIGLDYTDTGYEITQQSLFFPSVSARTKLRIDDYFMAPYLGAKVGFDDGNVFASIGGFVAPGLVITDASAKGTYLCGPCSNPGDRNFALSRAFSNTRFSVQTGLDLRLGARLTPSVTVEGGFQYVHTSHAGFLRPPTTPTEQPVSLGYGSANRFGGRFGVRITF